MKMWWNNKLFSSLNFIDDKTYPYGSKVIIRHYYHRSDPKSVQEIIVIRRILCIFYASTTILSLSWDWKSKKRLIRQNMVENILASTPKSLVVIITGSLWFLFMMEQMKKIKNTLIELFLMVLWWTCLW